MSGTPPPPNDDGADGTGDGTEPYGQERPQAWGSGEYDADATAFVQLTPDMLAGPTDMPLAAPGTGQGGYTPPPIDPTPPHGSPAITPGAVPGATPAATPDPAATGHWTMPFAGVEAEPFGGAEAAQPEAEPESEGGPAAALGQGAAAALAGSHEARTRRPLGDGGGAGASTESAIPFVPSVPSAEPSAGSSADPSAESGLVPSEVPAEAPSDADLGTGVSETEIVVDLPETPAPAAPEAEVPAYEADPYAPNTPAVDSEHPHTSYVLHVNGADRPVTSAWIGESLLYVLRERLGLAGAKDGCAQGECGACSVQVDGRLVASCLVPAATTAGCEIRTVEGLASNGVPSDVQCALAESGSVQCGFCVPGLAMTVHDLLEGNHAPSELETRQAISGNLCRCSGYRGVLDAVRQVVRDRSQAASAGEAEGPGAAIPQQARHPEWGGA